VTTRRIPSLKKLRLLCTIPCPVTIPCLDERFSIAQHAHHALFPLWNKMVAQRPRRHAIIIVTSAAYISLPSHDGTHAASLHQLLYLPPLAVRGTHTHAACSWRCHTHAILPHLASSLDPPPSTPQFILCSPTSEAKKRLFHVFAYPCQRTILVPASLSVLGNDVCFETN
jgi:hypothetical protein